MEQVSLTIDGQKVTVPRGTTILEAARSANINIPTLCYLKDINQIGACRVCLVEVQGARGLLASCTTPATEGMVVKTNTPAVREARKSTVELLISNHPKDCLTCVRNRNCELQTLAEEFGIREVRFPGEMNNFPVDTSSPIIRDPNKCILCRRCVAVCSKVQTVNAIGVNERGFETVVGPAQMKPLGSVACVNCGQCILVCPTGALRERDDTDKVWAALADKDKHVVVQTAPAVRVALGEAFGLGRGGLVTGKMVAALRRLGFDRVFDTDFSADLTILEEGTELIHRLQNGGTLPMITSCSPGWIKFIEHFYPDYLDHLSTCKSPQQMFGAVAKTYYARKMGIDPQNIVVVSVMPCTAKKFEAERPEMTDSGYPDVDIAITTRELARMIQEARIDFASLPEEEFDDPLGISTGAGVIFGATGGVMEAALRTVYEILSGKELQNIEFTAVRGLNGIKEAEVTIPLNSAGAEAVAGGDGAGSLKVKVAVAHGLGNARQVMDLIKAGKADYHFIEVMCCPGGCIGGGGQPIVSAEERWKLGHDFREDRIDSIYQEDRNLPIRKSHLNPAVKALYEEFLGEPCGEKSHHLLHTHYTKRGKYPKE